MNTGIKRILQVAFCVALIYSLSTAADDDDDKPTNAAQPAQSATSATLTSEQRNAVGILVAHPLVAKLPDRIESLGLVLDTTTLVSDIGDMTAVGAAERSTKAEVARLQALYGAGAGASLKMLEAVKAEEAKATAQSRFTAARFDQHWGPLGKMPPEKRRQLLEAVTQGRGLLLRADVPGRHSLPALPDTAQLDVDGVPVPGQILGVLRQADETQSVGLLIGVENAPVGLGPGARVPVALMMAQRSGLLLPREAVLYDEQGAYVFKQLPGTPTTGRPPRHKSDPAEARYVRVNVTLLLGHGNSWLVDGVDDDDDIVVAGAGVVWSLQGTAGIVADDD
jgi:hypothetical protein